MKKALIVSNSSGLVTCFLKNDVELLKGLGYEIDCACNTAFPDLNTESFFSVYDINVLNVDFPIRDLNILKIFRSLLTLKHILKSNKYDVIHCHSTIAAALVRQVAKKYRKSGTKIIYTSHGFPFYNGVVGKKSIIFKLIEKHYSRFTDAIITICNEDYENAKKMHFTNTYKINGVGVDLTRFEKENLDDGHFDRIKYREKLGFKDDDIVILSVGELNTNKNHQVVIRALNKVREKKLVYAICGREVTEVGKKDELLTLAKECDVDLRFLGFRNDIPEVCACIDIGAIPSFKEGLGLSGVELLASGIPVVGSCRQGIKDYVIDGKTGYLADPTSPDSFANAIIKTIELKNKDQTSEICKKIASQYSIDQSKKMIETVYLECL